MDLEGQLHCYSGELALLCKEKGGGLSLGLEKGELNRRSCWASNSQLETGVMSVVLGISVVGRDSGYQLLGWLAANRRAGIGPTSNSSYGLIFTPQRSSSNFSVSLLSR